MALVVGLVITLIGLTTHGTPAEGFLFAGLLVLTCTRESAGGARPG
jgi:hypothetical protein